ncbi:DNA-binding transcriptional regulator, MerR family [Lentzea xinjiangensis]|uniref:DNA-binding transcriptional regulator, MerR family n=1 Tax=Lentzea xinjiangensis TaxID=402600 RepID=A0A1H9HWC9_9PSEU|nr:MerR family transcriptional regulator [Lentzea xinjiangensis]SEQ66577.1 DNA-binding transcriptional regulator, MerR family [Lentzea xinjiangensis]
MTEQLYPIGDVARRTGLSVSAIRFYADEGVVPPTGHTDGGYRLYDVEAIARLELVRTLRDLGASVEDVRRLLAEETSLHDLATAHLVIVERQLRHLKARRAVLRTVVSQGGGARQVALMHELVSMSDEDREGLLDRFWSEVTDGLAVHPAFTEHLHGLRPVLPEEPGTEQLQAWIELAGLVRDAGFRAAVREFFHTSFASPEAATVTSPEVMARVEAHRLVEAEAGEAERSGVAPDSPRGREIAGRLLASLAGLTAEVTGAAPETAGLKRALGEPDPVVDEHARRAVAKFGDVLDRFVALTETISGRPLPDPHDIGASDSWVAAAVAAL